MLKTVKHKNNKMGKNKNWAEKSLHETFEALQTGRRGLVEEETLLKI